uniref:Uncharacterized protein n=1 Tax=Anguilla anguilla TaxID=7936 RepID=A0A0E9TVN6_ANGAN
MVLRFIHLGAEALVMCGCVQNQKCNSLPCFATCEFHCLRPAF